MTKTTIYLPLALKAGVQRRARQEGISEAEVIRRAVAAAVIAPRPQPGLLDAEPLAERVDELMEGFGTR
ncbi:type II toxin-antitoxin system antitoxin VapB26 [soil metagenome]